MCSSDLFRMPVQWVVRHDDGVDDVRGLAGRVESGTVAVGDEIVALPSGATTRIARIDVLGRDVESASAPLSVTLHFEDDVDVSRGDTIAHADDAPVAAARFTATVAWLDEQPLTVPAGRPLEQFRGPQVVSAQRTGVLPVPDEGEST